MSKDEQAESFVILQKQIDRAKNKLTPPHTKDLILISNSQESTKTTNTANIAGASSSAITTTTDFKK